MIVDRYIPGQEDPCVYTHRITDDIHISHYNLRQWHTNAEGQTGIIAIPVDHTKVYVCEVCRLGFVAGDLNVGLYTVREETKKERKAREDHRWEKMKEKMK